MAEASLNTTLSTVIRESLYSTPSSGVKTRSKSFPEFPGIEVLPNVKAIKRYVSSAIFETEHECEDKRDDMASLSPDVFMPAIQWISICTATISV